MKANVIHGDFNPAGGAERLSLVTLQALLEKGIEFDLTTLKSPDTAKLENSFGKNLASAMKSAKTINIINILEELRQQLLGEHDTYYNYDITINTNGDAAPFFHPSFTKDNTITYCHFPSTKYHIESENIEYLRTDLGITEKANYFSEESGENVNDPKSCKTKLQHNRRTDYFKILKYGYWNLMKNSTLITNSEFSRKAICNAFGLDNIYILSPPIDVETFSNIRSKKNGNERYKRKDIILVISRIAPHKNVKNAIKLAKILKDNNIGKGMKIVGNLYHYFLDYYIELQKMVLDLGLTDYITFEINASLDRLLSNVGESRVYFHPMVGEHFGMSVIEAMAGGLIAVVPNKGGVSEFVPQRYQFNTIEEAAGIIRHVFSQAPRAERNKLDMKVNKFSTSQYIKGFQTILKELIVMR
jgi:glycosyltransferase involved in cell wall biosynthesis